MFIPRSCSCVDYSFSTPLGSLPKTLSILGAVLIVLAGMPSLRAEESYQASVLDLFPGSGIPSGKGEASCSFDYVPSGSTWNPKVDEKAVFLASFKGQGWQLGVGKGGHIYSLRGPYGESVPPQRVASPWNDEVWQAVATHEKIIDPIHKYQAKHRDQYRITEPLMYFIHQAGIYTPGAAEGDTGKSAAFYSPCLGKHWDPETKTLRLVNWMQQAHTPCVWRSGLLIYTAFRDIGGGALEVNQVLHQFEGEPLDYFSAPWGGIRKSSMPNTVVSKADGSWAKEDGLWNWSGVPQKNVHDTAGWEAWVQDVTKEDSPALGFVFGTGKDSPGKLEFGGKHLILWGDAGRDDVRDYQVTEVSGQFGMGPGGSVSIRWYLVSGGFKQVRERSAQLAAHAHLKRISFPANAHQQLWHKEGSIMLNKIEGAEKLGSLCAFPAKGTVPVFLLKDKRSGKYVVSANIYAIADSEPYPNPLPKDHPEHYRYQNRVIYKQYSPHIGYENLLGYAYVKQPANASATKLKAPEGIVLHPTARRLWFAE